MLECNLIKEHQPRYNTMLKDDKAYPYIRVTVEEEFPRVLFARTMKKDKSRYFGPYTSAGAVKDTLELIRKLYQIRTCNRNLPRDIGKERPCLNYHIGQCAGPCQGYISKEDYAAHIKQVLDFLSGKYDDITRDLKKKMLIASEELRFEDAIHYRELLNSVQHIAQKQKITDTGSMEDRDVLAYAAEGGEGIMQVFFIREGKMIGRDHFHISIAEDDSPRRVMTSFVKQFYAGTPFVPRELFLQVPLEEDEEEMIASWLSEKRGHKVQILVPERGEKSRLVELAEKNAQMVLRQDHERIRKEEKRTSGAMKMVADWLNLSDIHRVEAFDISNISGFESVGSMVVFQDGQPRRNDYRKFRIKSVQGPNDYASMEEVLTRRFTHGMQTDAGGFDRFPDLIMMDGGRGQVNIALGVLEKLNLHIPVCGMVKDDHHRTRGLYYNNIEIPIDTHSAGFHLITRVQDEAHRFAIEYHRSLRGKKSTQSILDEIPGIGEARRKALMRAFGSLEAVRDAEVEDLAALDGMNQRAAQSVYDFFHKNPEQATPEVEEV